MVDSNYVTDGNELYYIYSLIRKLRCIQVAEIRGGVDGGKQKNKKRSALNTDELQTLETRLFPRIFLLKLLDERLKDLNELADELVKILFKRLGKQQARKGTYRDENLQDDTTTTTTNKFTTVKLPMAAKCSELDGYFHHSLHYLYNFFIELDWHEPDLSKLSKSDSEYVKNKLKHMSAFLAFQKALLDNIAFQKNKAAARKAALSASKKSTNQQLFAASSMAGVAGFSQQSRASSPSLVQLEPSSGIKSSLSSGLSSSQAQMRRVTFKEDDANLTAEDSMISSGSSISEIQDENRRANRRKSRRDMKQGQSILALELLLFALNMFAQRLCDHLSDWITSSPTFNNLNDDALKSIINSKVKIRTSQLRTLSKRIKTSLDVHLSVLDYLYELKKIYLNDYLLGVLCARDSERLIVHLKRPRVFMFIKRIGFDAEREIIAHLATQCLQVLLDLIISEINLPPIEFETETRTRSREELVRSRENYFNFITSWLNVDDVVFGLIKPKVNKPLDVNRSDKEIKINEEDATNGSNLAQLNPQFKSSSRILAQMENLNELARDLIGNIVERLKQDQQQLQHFLGLVHCGLESSFDTLVVQLSSQLSATNGSPGANKRPGGISNEELLAISESIDLIAAKVRCLKFIHIMSSLDKLIRDSAAGSRIALKERPIERKLALFASDCTNKTGSGFS